MTDSRFVGPLQITIALCCCVAVADDRTKVAESLRHGIDYETLGGVNAVNQPESVVRNAPRPTPRVTDTLAPGGTVLRSTDVQPADARVEQVQSMLTVLIDDAEIDSLPLVVERLKNLRVHVYDTCVETRCLTVGVPQREAAQVIGKIANLAEVRFIEPAPVLADEPVFQEHNRDAQDTHQVQECRAKHGVNGSTVQVGVWDGGRVVANHVEFAPRATQLDSPTRFSAHATHVCGTIGANGIDNDAQGLAPRVGLRCFDWFSDGSELVGQAQAGAIVCSNHSYGAIQGWHLNDNVRPNRWEWFGDPTYKEDPLFGKYNTRAQEFDDIVRRFPRLTVFASAGNERGRLRNDPNTDPNWNGWYWLRRSGRWSNVVRHADMFDRGGLDTIKGFALSKNVITVGAIEDITIDPPTADLVRVTSFSSWGPTDDGRIKPDVVANGARLFSPTYRLNAVTGQPFTDRYQRMSGTSMASPTAAGIGALLSEVALRSASLRRPLFADEMKAVLIHTAMSPNVGPTYQVGWGAIRADHAADVVAGQTGTIVRTSLVASGYEWKGTAVSSNGIRVTITWIDPPAAPNPRGLDDATSTLVNDLELEVVSPTNETFYPWSLDPSHPLTAATRSGPNNVDNVERVDVDAVDAVDGEWTVRVKGSRSALNQTFVVVVTGLGA